MATMADAQLLIHPQHVRHSKTATLVNMAAYRPRNERLNRTHILGMFAKLRKPAVSIVMCLSVRPPARMEQLGSWWTDLRKYVDKAQFC
jgi:hypothetical protein